nr:MraZ N-terminal domain containing protein [Mycoplasmopsis bovis]
MFGEFTRTIDEKNRIAIPAKLRDSLGKASFISQLVLMTLLN